MTPLQYVRYGRAVLRRSLDLLQDPVLRLVGHLRRKQDHVRARLPGSDPLPDSRLAAVYVHFDPRGVVHDYVVHQLHQLLDAGFRISFVTNSPAFPEASRDRVAPCCRTVLWRHNVGYDFGGYKDGIADIANLDGLDGLVLMNDSVYGPFWKLAEILSSIDRTKADFWGIVDSWQHRYHIQSFFIFFLPNSLKAAAFKKFWQKFPYVNEKSWIIRNGEIRLSQILARQQLRGRVLAPYWSVAETMKDRLADRENDDSQPSDQSFNALRSALLRGRPLNPMHAFWDALILDYKCPFVKRELVTSNPAEVPLTSRWQEIIAAHSNYDLDMIKQHLDLIPEPTRKCE